MIKKRRRILIETLKFVVAAGLLAWVLCQASWNDYVTITEGPQKGNHAFKSAWPDQASPQTVQITAGMLWWKVQSEVPFSQIEPICNKDGQLSRDPAGRIEFVRKGFISSIKDLDVPLLTLALLCSLVSLLLVAVRWWLLLKIQDIHLKLWEIVRLTFLGNFFNAVVPGTVGGDLVKAYYVSRHTHRKAAVLVSIFVDRVLGLTELTLLAGVMLAVVLSAGLESYQRVRYCVLAVAIVIAIIACAMTFVLSGRIRKLLHLQRLYSRFSFAHHIAAAGHAVALYRQCLPAFVKVIAINFASHIMWVGSIALIGMSLPEMRAATPWYSYFVYIPLIYIIGAVPVAPGGVGLIEKLYIVFFASVSPSLVLVMALLARFVPFLWALPGFWVYMTGPRVPKADQMQAELADDEK
jgi:uncharacterized protein (TIRG00374 family)